MKERANQGREEKEKKKKARGVFWAFLQRLRAACKVIKTADEWYELMKELTGLLQEYVTVIPADRLQRIERAMRPVEATRAGAKKACKVLDSEIDQLVRVLPGAATVAGSLAKVFLGGLVVVAVAVGALAAYVQYTAVDIAIVNDGCSPIVLPGQLPVPIPGLKLPQRPIQSGGGEKVTVPRLTVEVDATQPDTVLFTVLGVSVSYERGRQISSVRLDGREILGQHLWINPGERREHELVVSCR